MILKPLFALLFLGCVIFFYHYPLAGMIVLLFFSQFEIWKMQIFGTQWQIAEVVMILFIVSRIPKLQDTFSANPSIGCIIAILWLSTLLSSAFSLDPFSSLHSSFFFMLSVSLSALIGSTVTTQQTLTISYLKTTAVIVLLLLFGMTLHFRYSGDSAEWIHFSGGFHDWNYLCAYLSFVFPLVSVWLRETGFRFNHFCFFIVFLLYAAMFYFARSGSGFILFAITLLMCFMSGLFSRRQINWILPLFLVPMLHLPQHIDKLDISFLLKPPTWTEQTKPVELAMNALPKHPLLGVGFDQLRTYQQWLEPNLSIGETANTPSFFLILIELGMAGTILMVCLLAFPLTAILNSNGHRFTIQQKTIACTSVLIGISMLLIEMHHHLFTWCFLGILIGFAQSSHPTEPAQS